MDDGRRRGRGRRKDPIPGLPDAVRDAALAAMGGAAPRGTPARRVREATGLTPSALATLGAGPRGRGFAYTLPYGGPFNRDAFLAYLGRDPDNLAEQVSGRTFTRFFPLEGERVLLRLAFGGKSCRVAVDTPLAPARRLALHMRLRRFLSLDQPLEDFYQLVARHPVMGPITRAHHGLRTPQVPSLWEALCWAVIGQQINLAFAYRLRNRFIALGHGRVAPPEPPSGAGEDRALLAFPTPEQVLDIPEEAWRPAQFSRQKSAYLAGLARAFAEGALCEATLEAAPTGEAEAALLAVKGLGPWSVAYGLLRALGRTDALPVGDAGLRAALRHHYGLPSLPDTAAQLELMEPFRPFRGLATSYLWKSLNQLRAEGSNPSPRD